MKYIELKDKSLSELKDMVKKKKFELVMMKHRRLLGHLHNPKQMTLLRKDIARICTAITTLEKGNK